MAADDIRRITIEASTQGAAEATAALNKLAAVQAAVGAVTLTAEEACRRQTAAIDARST